MSKIPSSLAFLSACAALLVVAPGAAHAREKHKQHLHHSSAAGRYHLRKANALAGANKCTQAVREYTRAYDKLRDPVLLFNRAECYRRMKEDQKAAADYRAFLKEFPRAPNRAEIESRIAALEGTPGPPPEPKARARAEPPPPAAAPPPPPTVAVAPPPPPAPSPPASTPPPSSPPEPAFSPAIVTPLETEQPPPPAAADRAAPPTAAYDAPSAPVLLESRPAPAPSEKRASGGSHWWVFVALGLVVAGGATAGYLLLRPKGQTIPTTDLGDYRF